MGEVKSIIKLVRPNQWVKNFFVLGPLIFSNKFNGIDILVANLLTVISFCFISSAVYILNDIVDKENDKNHPQKCNRPIASGKISVKKGIFILSLLVIISTSIAGSINKYILLIITIYLLNNILYSFKIKNVVIIDVFSIAFGFVLRVLAGGFATGVQTSSWIILCTLFLALFLGFGKRRSEVIILGEKADKHRKNLSEYNEDFLDKMIGIVLTCTIVFYSIYCILGSTTENFIWTTLLVIWGVLRYYYLMYSNGDCGSPTDLVLKDKQLIFCIILWGIVCVVILNI